MWLNIHSILLAYRATQKRWKKQLNEHTKSKMKIKDMLCDTLHAIEFSGWIETRSLAFSFFYFRPPDTLCSPMLYLSIHVHHINAYENKALKKSSFHNTVAVCVCQCLRAEATDIKDAAAWVFFLRIHKYIHFITIHICKTKKAMRYFLFAVLVQQTSFMWRREMRCIMS